MRNASVVATCSTSAACQGSQPRDTVAATSIWPGRIDSGPLVTPPQEARRGAVPAAPARPRRWRVSRSVRLPVHEPCVPPRWGWVRHDGVAEDDLRRPVGL